MVQSMPRYCPRCSAPLAENQRICSRCGFNLDAASLAGLNAEQEPALQQQDQQNFPPATLLQQATQQAQISQHPSAPPQISQHPFPQQPQISMHPLPLPAQQISQHPFASPSPQISLHPQPVQPISQHPEASQLADVPTLVQPAIQVAAPRRKRSKWPVLVLILLVVLIIVGAAGYAGYTHFAHRAPTQTPISTSNINSTAVDYAGVDVTLLSVQRSQIFLDDPNIDAVNTDQTTTMMLRLAIQAQNKGSAPVNMLYEQIAHLVLPGGKIVNPVYVKSIPGIASGDTQTAKVDFVVPAKSPLDQLVLRLGAANEAQMDIPLMANADLSKYAPKTVKLNGSVAYQNLNWSLVNATLQLSVDGQQAGNGMQFVTITLKVDNKQLEQPAIPGSPFDYLRLKAGNTTATPENSSLPLMLAKGDTGKTGEVTFQAPQNATALTLVFQQANGFDGATLNFHL